MEYSLVILLVAMCALMFFSSRKNKKAQQEVQDFRSSLAKGDKVMTGSGLIGVIVEVDKQTNSIVLDSEGSKSRWLADAITKVPPAKTATEIEADDETDDKTAAEKLLEEKKASKKSKADKNSGSDSEDLEAEMEAEADLMTDEDRQTDEENGK